MADAYLGRRLIAAGWDQGVLLPALRWGLNFHLDDPVTKIAKGAKNQAEAEYAAAQARGSTPIHRHAFAAGVQRREDRLVVASQACDIITSPSEEPTVLALRAFTTAKQDVLRAAGENSSRLFLLDPERGLVADATVVVPIEKPMLLDFQPEPGAVDDATRIRFGRWLAHRFSRPALDERVVEAVVAPILNNLRAMREANDPDLSVLDMLREVRLGQFSGEPPYEVHLLFITPNGGLPDGGLALARLVTRIRTWLHPDKAMLATADAFDMYQVTAGDYQDTQKLYLDHYTYRGRTIRGLEPPLPI